MLATSLERWLAENAPCASRKAAQQNFRHPSINPFFGFHMGLMWRKPSIQRPDLRLGYLLNLSILVSRGIETKRDSLSNGERTGKSSCLKSRLLSRFVASRRETSDHAGISPLVTGMTEGESPV